MNWTQECPQLAQTIIIAHVLRDQQWVHWMTIVHTLTDAGIRSAHTACIQRCRDSILEWITIANQYTHSWTCWNGLLHDVHNCFNTSNIQSSRLSSSGLYSCNRASTSHARSEEAYHLSQFYLSVVHEKWIGIYVGFTRPVKVDDSYLIATERGWMRYNQDVAISEVCMAEPLSVEDIQHIVAAFLEKGL